MKNNLVLAGRSIFLIAAMLLLSCLNGCNTPNPPEPPGPGDDTDTTQIKTDTTTHTDGDITYQLKENVSFLTDTVMQHISSHTPDSSYMYGDICQFGSFHVDASIPKSMFPKQGSGDCFIINDRFDIFPEGLIAGINTIEDTGDGYDVKYYVAHLTDAFKNLNIGEQSIALNEHVKKVVDRHGKPMQFRTVKDASIDKYHLEISGADFELPLGFTLTPKMVLDLVLKMQMIIEDGKLYTFTTVLESDVAFDAEISASLSLYNMDKTFDLCTIYFAAIPVGPLVITPAIEVVGIVGASGEVKLSTEISYTQKYRTEVHYDVNDGLSASNRTLENEKPFKCETQPKLSGAVKYGLGIGPSIGVYGKAVAISFDLDCMLQEELEWSSNLYDFDFTADPKIDHGVGGYSNEEFISPGYIDTKYIWSMLLAGTANFKGYGFTGLHISTPELKIQLDSRTLLPKLSKTYTFELEDNRLAFHTWILSKAVTYPAMRLAFSTMSSQTYQVLDYLDFQIGSAEIDALENGADSVEISCYGILDENISYLQAHPEYLFHGNYHPIDRSYRTNFTVYDNKLTKVIKSILKDIRSCGQGDWPGCNWEEPISLAEMNYIECSSNGLRINIPQEWKMKSALIVDSHSEELVDSGFSWNLSFYDLEHEFTTVDIEDPCCTFVLTGENVENYTMRSQRWSGGSNGVRYIPENVKVLDLGNSSLTYFDLPKSVRGLETLKVDNCPKLLNLNVCMHTITTQISANNCPNLNWVVIDSLRQDFTWPYDCKLLRFNNSQIGALTVTGLSHLEILYCDDSGITALNLSNLPNIKELWCFDNHGLTSEMLPIFDEMFSKGYAPRYDQRYTYNADGTVKSDLGYGFYYHDEPGRGYHRK